MLKGDADGFEVEFVEVDVFGNGCLEGLVEAALHVVDRGVVERVTISEEVRGVAQVGGGDFRDGVSGDRLEMFFSVFPGGGC